MADKSRRKDAIGSLFDSSNYTVPLPWPVPPGEAPLRGIPPTERDRIERQPVWNGYDTNAVQGEDLMRQYFWPQDYPQDEKA
jgi:hypothetical protein